MNDEEREAFRAVVAVAWRIVPWMHTALHSCSFDETDAPSAVRGFRLLTELRDALDEVGEER